MSLANIKTAIVNTAIDITSNIASNKINEEISSLTSDVIEAKDKLDKYGVDIFDPTKAVTTLSDSVINEQVSQQDTRNKLDTLRKSLTADMEAVDNKILRSYTTGICNRKQDAFSTAVVDGVIKDLTPDSIKNPSGDIADGLNDAATKELAKLNSTETTASEDKSALATIAGALKDVGKDTLEALTENTGSARDTISAKTSPLTSAVSSAISSSSNNTGAMSGILSAVKTISSNVESSAIGVIRSDLTGLLGDIATQNTIRSVGSDISTLMAEPTINEVRTELAKAAIIEANTNTTTSSVAKAIDEIATAKASEEGNAQALEQSVKENKIIWCSGRGNCNRAAKTCQQTPKNIVSTIATAEALGVNLDTVTGAKIKEPTQADNKAIDLTKPVDPIPEDPIAAVFDETVDLVEFKELIKNGTAMAKLLLGTEKFNTCMAMLQAEEAKGSAA